MRYQLIRDKRIFELDESKLEICDSAEEISNFSIKELINLLSELQETDCKDVDIYVDILSILDNLAGNNNINPVELKALFDKKEKKHGAFSKYLLKIH